MIKSPRLRLKLMMFFSPLFASRLWVSYKCSIYPYIYVDTLEFNPSPDKQITLLGIVPKQVCHFRSLSVFCLGCRAISWRAARLLIVLHPEQNTESGLKLQTCYILWHMKQLIVSERVMNATLVDNVL